MCDKTNVSFVDTLDERVMNGVDEYDVFATGDVNDVQPSIRVVTLVAW